MFTIAWGLVARVNVRIRVKIDLVSFYAHVLLSIVAVTLLYSVITPIGLR